MCCGCSMCRICTCLILLVILIGLLFGFGVFKHGFDKLKDKMHVCDPTNGTFCSPGRPFLVYGAPAPL
ncbi:hypothetical protein BVC80_1799g21 [Macleaya cordata]|uniref:Transmembrane protein n=1 Tax=Macleaya cordata TaxID=56857 RepID=A0A200QPH0_MACCD|nr:hypothetical protein BVC80_1799g21 [Macleaya cordata]